MSEGDAEACSLLATQGNRWSNDGIQNKWNWYKQMLFFGGLIPVAMLDRYKKKGGFYQLLQLIETSNPKKQEQFLGLIAAENKAWEQTLKKKILDTNKIFTWPAEHLVEIISRLQILTLAGALQGESKEFIDQVLGCLGPIGKRKIMDQMAELNPNPAEKAACQFKIVTEVRNMIHQGYIKLDKINEELVIDEDIEDKLAHMAFDIQEEIHKVRPKEADNSGSLDFSSADRKSTEEAKPTAGMSPAALEEEIKFLRKKLNGAQQENVALKSEIQIYKDKLAQIKKIA